MALFPPTKGSVSAMGKRWVMRVGECVIAGTDSDVFLHGFPKKTDTTSPTNEKQKNTERREPKEQRKAKGG